jgi:L,D-transpeptidase YcbB
MKQIFILFLAIGITIFQTSCKRSRNKTALKKDIDITLPQQIKPKSNLVFDSSYSALFFKKYPKLNSIEADWNDFYIKRNFSFAWVDTAGITSAAFNLHNRINNLSDAELNDSLWYREAFNQLIKDASTLNGKDLKDSTLILAEMMLTSQYLMYAKQIYSALGADELKKIGWNIAPQKISYTNFLNEALENKTDVFENEPVYYQYTLLQKYLQQYKKIATNGGFPAIDTSIKMLKPNEQHKGVFSIKKYLFTVGDLKKLDSSNIYNDATVAAIKQFRIRHGLKDTSLIDKNVIQQMQVPIAKRMEQIVINMQRSKWMPHNPSNDYISVNIPDYTMQVYENSKLQFSINVVVGALATKTVIFSDTLKTIAFSPYWNVPYSIYKKELAGRSAASLRSKNMEYTGPNSVRQLPGGNNALGKVKFLFPNHYNIYFHDTPSKDKFGFTQRAFSHGCIRLSEPKKLAAYLLRKETMYTSKVIDSLMNQKRETNVRLKKPIPVVIGYFTSFVNPSNGLLQFRKDIYSYDSKVLDGLLKK